MNSKAPNPEKGARYLSLLDQALCNGTWSDIPELARKTEKHAPNRKCLTLAARSEAQIASASHRPTSASSNPGSIHGLSDLIPRLEEGIAVGNSIEEDAFVAAVCLAEIHWLREDHEAALRALPEHVPKPSGDSTLPTALGWMEVCRVKVTYIRASALESLGKEEEPRALYLQGVEQTPGSRTLELRRWTERLVAKACMYYHGQSQSASIKALSEALKAFSTWSDFWQRSPPPSGSASTTGSRIDLPRRQVWRAYYDLLSKTLQYGLMYYSSPGKSASIHMGPVSSFPESIQTAARTKQRAELKRVETTYETLLINETQFPKASQSNREVEEWVEQATNNWHIICGPGWSDSELGEGGKESVTRNMLDILYRAATKTFHSTAVLRQLFHVHAALGEFDLAMHAFDSYTEIVSRGKARAEKTGQHEIGFDDDDTAALTAVEAVRVLCRYGDRTQAEKAVEVGKNLQKWLARQRPTSADEIDGSSKDNRAQDAHPVSHPTGGQLKPTTLAAAYRAIGISLAHWAGLTYDTDSRPTLQADALKHLKQAEAQDATDPETAYALAHLLAETREVPAAILVLRRALAAKPTTDSALETADYTRQRKLLPLWHLLSLCLTAKEQYEPAARMCEAAFEQFGDTTVLLGQSIAHGRDLEKQSSGTRVSRGVVDSMEGLEKEGIVQIKMTQLTLTELMEGPSVAVDMTDELLGLYARLFGNPEQAKVVAKPPTTALSTPPAKTGGTLRSIAGSIRPKSNRNSVEKEALNDKAFQAPATNGATNADATAFGSPVSITVTNEDGRPADQSRGRPEHAHHHHHLPFKLRGHSAIGRSRSRSAAAQANANENQTPTADAAATAGGNPAAPNNPEQPMQSIPHNDAADAWPPPVGHEDQPPRQDVRLPAPHPAANLVPEPRFPSVQTRRHKISLLVKIWLFIAELYVRAEMLDDASGAVEEAGKLAEAFEVEVGREESSAKAFFWKGWGCGKGVDALWAEVWCAVSQGSILAITLKCTDFLPAW